MRCSARTFQWIVFFAFMLVSTAAACAPDTTKPLPDTNQAKMDPDTFGCEATDTCSDASTDAGDVATDAGALPLPYYCPDHNGNGLPDCQDCVQIAQAPPGWIRFDGRCDPDDDAPADAGTPFDGGSMVSMDAGMPTDPSDAGPPMSPDAGSPMMTMDAGMPPPPPVCTPSPPNVDTCQVADPAPGNTLVVYWGTFNGATMQSITFSGEAHEGGLLFPWADLVHASDASSIVYVRDGVASGDSLRFSVQFEDYSGDISWGCIGPWPSYTVQGVLQANVGDYPVPIVATADPTSDGCGYTVYVP